MNLERQPEVFRTQWPQRLLQRRICTLSFKLKGSVAVFLLFPWGGGFFSIKVALSRHYPRPLPSFLNGVGDVRRGFLSPGHSCSAVGPTEVRQSKKRPRASRKSWACFKGRPRLVNCIRTPKYTSLDLGLSLSLRTHFSFFEKFSPSFFFLLLLPR